MSGLAGILCLDDRPVERAALERMAAAAPYLGPDGIGVSLSGPAGLLSFQTVTTPEAVREAQPLHDKDAGWTLTFDGRLDNRDALRRSLPETCRPPVNAPDSAFLLAAFAAWGEDCPASLAGDFAFALWQSRERRLFCARSLKAFRPFVWWSDGKTFLFASEVSQIFAAGGPVRRVNEGFAGEILACAPTSVSDTLWDGVFHLPPGQAMTVDARARRTWRWHQGPFPEIRYKDDRDYEAHFRHLLVQALGASLRSAGPVAMDLSGGLDSSSLVCLAAEMQQSGAIQTPIQPFSLVFPGQPQDESEWIDLVAAHTGWEPVRAEPPPYDWDYWRKTAQDSMDLPLRPNAATRRALLAEMQARACRVVICGEGGDDWLRGSHAHWPDLLRRGEWGDLWRQARQSEALSLSFPLTLRRVASTGVLPLISKDRRERLLSGRPGGLVPDWIAPEWARKIHLADRLRARPEGPAFPTLGQHWLYEQNLLRPQPVLSLSQRLHTLHRIETRAPLHDRRILEFVLGIPGDQLRRQGEKKSLLRRALKGTLPEPLRQRQDKAEFSTPIQAALEGRKITLHLPPYGWVREGFSFTERRSSAALWNAVALTVWLEENLE